MTETITRRSPIHDWFESRDAEWRNVDGCPVVVQFRDNATERAAAESLGLCDLSGLPKIGVKGSNAEEWLVQRQVEVPADLYATRNGSDGRLVARIASDEFLIEKCLKGESLESLTTQLDELIDGVFPVERQEATFLLTGSRALDVLAQTCGIDFRNTPSDRVLYTRVAGVSCGIVPQIVGTVPVYRLWIDYSFAPYLWETLVDICDSLQGQVIGAGCLFPELQ